MCVLVHIRFSKEFMSSEKSGIQETAQGFHIMFPGKHLGWSSRIWNSRGVVSPSYLCLSVNHLHLLAAVPPATKALPKLPQWLLLPRQYPDVPEVAPQSSSGQLGDWGRFCPLWPRIPEEASGKG